MICESYDDKGNAIVYEYKAEDSAEVNPIQVHERNRTAQNHSAPETHQVRKPHAKQKQKLESYQLQPDFGLDV